jgi:hypothetical protein
VHSRWPVAGATSPLGKTVRETKPPQ